MAQNSSSGGMSIFSVLTVIFIVLKLVGVINWSWWWVFSPLLIGLGLAFLAFLGLAFALTKGQSR
jgi:hypothetical protein